MKIPASRCTKCVRAIVPPRETCPYCGRKQGIMEQIEIENRGTVISYTTLQMPPTGFEPPLTMALVELDHGAVVLCLAADQNNSIVKINDTVELSRDNEDRLLFQVQT